MSNTLQNSPIAVVQPEFVGESPLMANRRVDDPAVHAIGSFLTADMLGWIEEINTKTRIIHDEGTVNHMWRVGISASIAAQAHGFDVVSAVVGGGLHDNAKGKPEILEIINSDRRLTPEDRKIVNLHSERGA